MGGQAGGHTASPAAAGWEAGVQRHTRMPCCQVLAFTTTNLAQGVMLTMPFTVAVFMVRAFEDGQGDEAQIGRLTGLLAAVYSFAQFTTSYAWGVFSSRCGRKPVMVLGSGASAVTLLWFGLSGSYAGAATARVVAGLLNGIIVSWKCSIGESCTPLEQGRVLSLMSLSWGIGCILGPSIGGIASSPCNNSWAAALPGCGPHGLLRHKPYFLPCAISAAVNAAALCLNVCVLRETLPQLVAAKQQQQQQQQGAGPTPWSAAVRGWARRLLSRHTASSSSSSSSAPYERVSSQVGRPDSSSTDSGCGPSCTGCSVCWELWRAESGLVHTLQQQQQQPPQQHVLQPLPSERSALHLELAAVKQQQQHHSSGSLHESDGSTTARQLARMDSAIQHQQHQQQKGSSKPLAHSLAQQQQQAPPAAGLSTGRRLRPNDSASEYTLQQLKGSSGKQQQQHFSSSAEQQQQDLPQGLAGQDQQQQQQDTQGARFDEGSDCTIAVSPPPQQYQQLHSTDQVRQQEDATACDTAPLLDKQPAGAHNSSSSSSHQGTLLPWYKQRQVVLVLLAYGTVCLLFCAIDELTPIFASAPLKQGGLKLSEVQLAGPLSFSGACLILISLLAFPAAQKAWGTLAVTRCGLVLAVLVAFAIPSTSFAAAAAAAQTQAPVGSGADSGVPQSDLGWLAWGLLYLAMLLKSLAGCFAFTGTMIVVNTSVEPQQLGEVNGVGQSLASLARGLGPAVGGLLWGITVHLQGRVAGAQLLPFACVAATAVTALVIYAFVRPSDGVEVERTPGTTCCQE